MSPETLINNVNSISMYAGFGFYKNYKEEKPPLPTHSKKRISRTQT
jgi:hypothetical protein